MKVGISRAFYVLVVFLLAAVLAIPGDILAQDHIVTSSDIQRDISASSTSHNKNLARLDSLFSSPEAQQAMKSTHIDYQQVKSGISQLSDDELAQLSARSDKAQKDFSAGALSNRDLIIIILGIAALILIIVAVR